MKTDELVISHFFLHRWEGLRGGGRYLFEDANYFTPTLTLLGRELLTFYEAIKIKNYNRN
jgi:hypothetical protein